MKEILISKTMIIHLKLSIHKALLSLLCVILIDGCAQVPQYSRFSPLYDLKDVEEQVHNVESGNEAALQVPSRLSPTRGRYRRSSTG